MIPMEDYQRSYHIIKEGKIPLECNRDDKRVRSIVNKACSSDKKLIIYLSRIVISSYKSESLSKHHKTIGGSKDNEVYEFIVMPRFKPLELSKVIAATPVANLLKIFLRSLFASSSIKLSDNHRKMRITFYKARTNSSWFV